jgi:GR25 family glycosyltransferase involved in LPS biosynthesis
MSPKDSRNSNANFRLYVAHYHLLTSRYAYISKHLPQLDSVQYICIERDFPAALEKYYLETDGNKWSKKCQYLYSLSSQPRRLTKPEIASGSTHMLAWDIHNSENQEEWLVVIEDDAIWEGDLIAKIGKALGKVPPIVDALFIGGGYDHNIVSKTIASSLPFVIKKHPATNTVVGYALRRDILSNLLSCCDTLTLPVDWELAYRLYKVNAVVAHYIPYIINEGSKSIYNSTVEQFRSVDRLFT